jgi:hypothetical protein
MRQTTPAKPTYPFDWPGGKPSRETRRPKRKWRRKARGLTPVEAYRRLNVPSPHAAAGRGNPRIRKAHSATPAGSGAFFMPEIRLWRAGRGTLRRGRCPFEPVFHPRSVRRHPAVESSGDGSNTSIQEPVMPKHPYTQAAPKIRPVIVSNARFFPVLQERSKNSNAYPRHYLFGYHFGVADDREITIQVHTAGRTAVWELPVSQAVLNKRLVAGLLPEEAMRLGLFAAEDRERRKAREADDAQP